jgi:hypothetical protein
MEIKTKIINNVKFEFKLVKGILVETVESYLNRTGAIEVFSMKRKKIGEYKLSEYTKIVDTDERDSNNSLFAA